MQRAGVVKALYGMRITNGILGSFTINDQGDTSGTSITIYRQVSPSKFVPVKTLVPPASLVK